MFSVSFYKAGVINDGNWWHYLLCAYNKEIMLTNGAIFWKKINFDFQKLQNLIICSTWDNIVICSSCKKFF